MTTFIAIAHIVGAFIAWSVWGLIGLALASWEARRNDKAANEEASLALEIPVSDLENTEHEEKVIKFVADKFSSELFQNRFSDFCGWILNCWSWLGMLIQWGFLIGVVWYTFTDNLAISVHAWWVIAITLGFGIPGVLFAFICRLLTGRSPGQARKTRKVLAEVSRNRHAT